MATEKRRTCKKGIDGTQAHLAFVPHRLGQNLFHTKKRNTWLFVSCLWQLVAVLAVSHIHWASRPGSTRKVDAVPTWMVQGSHHYGASGGGDLGRRETGEAGGDRRSSSSTLSARTGSGGGEVGSCAVGGSDPSAWWVPRGWQASGGLR